MTKKSGRQRSVASENDESLMERAARGQTAALATLIDRYYGPILAYLFRLTGGRRQVAEDLAQETFLRLMRQASYQTGRAFRPWLYAVATNLAHDHFRAAGQREENGHDAVLAEIVDNVPGPEARAEAADKAEPLPPGSPNSCRSTAARSAAGPARPRGSRSPRCSPSPPASCSWRCSTCRAAPGWMHEPADDGKRSEK
jgi:hypothetical protein